MEVNPTTYSLDIFHNQILITGNESSDSLSFINTTITESIAKYEKWIEPVGVASIKLL